MSMEMNKALVEQAGGDERAAFELFVRKHCGMPAHIAVNWDAKFTNDAWEGWKARAALEPSPVQAEQAEGAHVPDEVFAGVFAEWWEEEGQYCRAGGGDYERTFAFQAWRHLYPLLLQARAALAQPSPAPELERPEVAEVAFVLRNIGAMDAEDIDGDNVDLRFEDAEGRDTGCDVSIVEYAEKAADLFEQHDRIVGALRAENAKLSEALDRWPLIRDSLKLRLADALARVAELERQEPVAWMHDQPNRVDVIHRDVKDLLQRVPGSSRGIHRPLDVSEHYTIPLYAAPVAQAQHSVPELLVRAEDFVSGKEVPQAWLDVQAERRRQITAEGWTPDHDDLYCAAELPRAAAAYILSGANDEAPAIWPFSAKWWKPRDARANYMRAGALILAEIERLDRAAPGKEVGHE
ncbi:hypothetical protein PAERUG_P33_London_28_VIM_2_02_12_01016 [Pseudomonas aeruginosa]|nr:hypothetical protein PAERUG_P33_London_28_VIM_2_02_12_01016 [Pseudomonas aeruginosa]